MTDQHIRVYLAEGDEQQLADLVPDDYVEFAGSINGADIPVRFYRAEVDEDNEDNEDESPVTEPHEQPHVLVTGNPADGFTYYGPFIPNTAEVEKFVEDELHSADWWYVRLLPIPNTDPS